MADTSHRTTSEQQAVKRAKARKKSKSAMYKAPGYYLLHRWLPKGDRK